ncbi:hypothetical protein K440DRAFT_290391 [Wilcoxina mikolae CBS 423.85]|nr:hypothetical protein K440DRAFT_290391 [Wilcoxina mikolae CBS 423.85]
MYSLGTLIATGTVPGQDPPSMEPAIIISIPKRYFILSLWFASLRRETTPLLSPYPHPVVTCDQRFLAWRSKRRVRVSTQQLLSFISINLVRESANPNNVDKQPRECDTFIRGSVAASRNTSRTSHSNSCISVQLRRDILGSRPVPNASRKARC